MSDKIDYDLFFNNVDTKNTSFIFDRMNILNFTRLDTIIFIIDYKHTDILIKAQNYYNIMLQILSSQRLLLQNITLSIFLQGYSRSGKHVAGRLLVQSRLHDPRFVNIKS